MAIDKRINPMQSAAEELVIKDEADEIAANELLSNINKVGDALEADKQKIYAPAWAAVVAIREKYKPREDIIKNAVALVRRKMTEYRTEAKRIADEKAAKIAERVAKGQLKVDTGVRKMDEINAPVGAVNSTAGSTRFKTVQCFEVETKEKLPMEYLMADEVAIRKAMDKGIKLPGVRYFTEERPSNFR